MQAKICAGCNQPITGFACDWQSVATGETRWYCGDCDDKLIQDVPLPRDEVQSAAAVLGTKGGSMTSKAKAKAARANGKKGGRPKKKAA